MDKALTVAAFVSTSLSVIASFGIIYALLRLEQLIDKIMKRYDQEKKKTGDKITAIMDLIKED